MFTIGFIFIEKQIGLHLFSPLYADDIQEYF